MLNFPEVSHSISGSQEIAFLTFPVDADAACPGTTRQDIHTGVEQEQRVKSHSEKHLRSKRKRNPNKQQQQKSMRKTKKSIVSQRLSGEKVEHKNFKENARKCKKLQKDRPLQMPTGFGDQK